MYPQRPQTISGQMTIPGPSLDFRSAFRLQAWSTQAHCIMSGIQCPASKGGDSHSNKNLRSAVDSLCIQAARLRHKNSGWYGQEEWTSTGIQTAKHTSENITSTYAESKNGFKTLRVHNTINLCGIQILIGGVNTRDSLNQTWILLFTEKC